jgi:hypothetical protein
VYERKDFLVSRSVYVSETSTAQDGTEVMAEWTCRYMHELNRSHGEHVSSNDSELAVMAMTCLTGAYCEA